MKPFINTNLINIQHKYKTSSKKKQQQPNYKQNSLIKNSTRIVFIFNPLPYTFTASLTQHTHTHTHTRF